MQEERKSYSLVTSCCSKEARWFWGERPKVCPFCEDPYWDKPGLEYKLFHLQDKFVADFESTGSTRILGEEMFPLIEEYAENQMKGLLKGKAYIHETILEEKAHDAATKLIEVIMKTPDKRMIYSFGGFLGRLVKNTLYGDQDHENNYSLQYILGDDEQEFGEVIHKKVKVKDDSTEEGFFYEEYKLDNKVSTTHNMNSTLSGELETIIKKSVKILRSTNVGPRVTTLYLLGLFSRLSGKTDRTMSQFYELVGNDIRLYVEKGELVIFNYLRELARGSANAV